MRNRHNRAFTLVELLVVIAIIAVLIAILLPVLKKAKEAAVRTDCGSRLHELAQAVYLYADDFRGKLPPGNRDNNNEEHCIWISQATFDAFLKVATKRKMLSCPNLEDTQPNYPTNNIGWVLGYSYLGGHLKLREVVDPTDWKSPLKLGEHGSPAIFCDLNDWSPTDGWTAVGHTRAGTGGFFMNSGGATPTQLGSIGGNVAYLDGSVAWRDIRQMQDHQTYSGSPTMYRGMW